MTSRGRTRSAGLVLAMMAGCFGASPAHPAEDVRTPGFGTAPPNVVRAVEVVLAGRAPLTIHRVGDPDPQDGIKAWWTSLGRRALPALLAELAPAALGSNRWRRGAALRGLSYLVRPRDARGLRALYERGYRDVLLLLLLLDDACVPRYVAESIDRGDRGKAIELAASWRPHDVIDQAALRALDPGPVELGAALEWVLGYVEARGLAEALPRLDRWAARLAEDAAPGRSIRHQMVVARSITWAENGDPLPSDWRNADRPVVWRVPRVLGFAPRWSGFSPRWDIDTSDAELAIHGLRARLGSSDGLMEVFSLGRGRHTDAAPGRQEASGLDVRRVLRRLIDAELPSNSAGWTGFANWWQANRYKLRYDPEDRVWRAP